MTPIDRDALLKELTFAGNDPGHAGQISGAPTNYKGDRSMGRWIADAVMVGPIFSAILAQADTAAQAVAERDDADRRAGAAERRYENERDTTMRRDRWLREAKERAGYHDDISFDTVWAETLAKAESAPALQAENALLRDIINAGLAETAFAVADERDGSATDQTRRVRYAGIRDALRGVGDPKRVAALAAGQDKEGGKPTDPTPQKDRDHG